MKVRLWIALAAQLILFASLNLFDDWTLEIMPIKFVVSAILCGLAYLVAATEFSNPGKYAIWIFTVVTIALRLLALPLAPANEVWRFQADGALQRAGFNPYTTAPADAPVSSVDGDVARVPRRDQPTSFAPGAELLFRAIPASRSALTFKLIFGAAELLAIALLMRVVNVQTAAWFAWNPLIAYSFFGAGHFDSIVLLCLAALIVCLNRVEQNSKPRWQFAFAASLALGIAIALRPISVVLLLPCLFALKRHALALLVAIGVPILAAAALGWPGNALTNLSGDFSQISRLNDLFWWIIEETVLPNWHQRYFRYDVVILLVSIAIGLFFARDWRRGMIWSLGAALVLAPILHAWYVAWILPIATWRRAFGWHFLSVTIFAYYLFFNERLFALPWHAEPWMRGMIILPVLFSMVTRTVQTFSRRRAT